MSRRAVCFDLDDTLYDYHQYARSGLRAAADLLERRFGRDLHEELASLYFDESVTDGTFDELCRRYRLPPDVVDDLVAAYHAAEGPLVPYPEAPRVVETLRERHRLGLVTDGRGGQRKLERLGLDGTFDAVLVTAGLCVSKHDPAPFRRVLVALSVPPGRSTYVGDDPRVDFRAPNQLGMRTVRLRRGRHVDLEPPDEEHAPDEEIDRLDELLPLLGPDDRDADLRVS